MLQTMQLELSSVSLFFIPQDKTAATESFAQ